jgi:cytochrome c peroxidase
VPSLRYLDRTPPFGIGPDREDDDAHRSFGMTLLNVRGLGRKVAGARTDPSPRVPRGGLFWDGRSGSFQMQAALPLLNPAEMANADQAALVTKIRTLGYAVRLERALGAEDVNGAPSSQLLDEALFAIARFEFEDVSFHPYTSRYDRWLEGEGRLTTSELRGLRVFDDPARGNCAACHLDRPGPDGRPPAFTDWQYEALGVPRNRRLAANRDPRYFDLGLCGPVRADLAREPQWCGMFRTPSLRNVALRRTFFHNGAYASLEEVVRFYNLRDTRASLIYPVQDDRVLKFDDLPRALQHNVDVLDPPFDRHDGDPPPMAPQDVRDLVAFLQTLTDEP